VSKSLKNFITIRQALSKQGEWNPRSLRICFLFGTWSDPIEITEDMLKGTAAFENKVNNFFLKALDVARSITNEKSSVSVTKSQEVTENDQRMLKALEKAKADVDAALCDSFNTPVAMRAISDLISEFNIIGNVSPQIALDTSRWVTWILTVFGLDKDGDLNDKTRIVWSGVDVPHISKPYIYPASELRDKIRQAARSGTVDHAALVSLVDDVTIPVDDEKTVEDVNPYRNVLDGFKEDVKKLASTEAPAKDLLALCDQLRDVKLWDLGIYLEDRDPPLPAMVRPVDRSLREAREEREKAASAKLEAKKKREAEEAEKKRQANEKAKMDPLEMFRTDEFTEWDENGIPTKDNKGEEVAKSRKKRLVKEWEKQKKMHEEWKAGQSSST
jgi:cysteinyl-tRNA synthetase